MRGAGDLLREAAATVEEREADYGWPGVHWGKVAALANELFETDLFTAERVAKLWMLDKLVRDEHRPRHDNILDVAGYADGISRVRSEPGDFPTPV